MLVVSFDGNGKVAQFETVKEFPRMHYHHKDVYLTKTGWIRQCADYPALMIKANYWIDYEGCRVTLDTMIRGYINHLNLHFGQIHELL